MNINQINYLLLIIFVIVGVIFGASVPDSDEYFSASSEIEENEVEWTTCLVLCMFNVNNMIEGTDFDREDKKMAYCKNKCEEIERIPVAKKVGKMRGIKKALGKAKDKVIRAKNKLF